MRSEAEVRNALHHMVDAQRGAAISGDEEGAQAIGKLGDILNWVLGQNSLFAEVLEMCDAADREQSQDERRRN